MKVINIDGKPNKVFVLKETKDSLVYIPVKALFRVDYERLVELEKQGGELLKVMQKTTLDNGRNALVQYDNVIQVLRYKNGSEAGTRLKRPEENIFNIGASEIKAETAQPENVEQKQPQPQQTRNKPGPKKGSVRRKTSTA